MTNIFLNHGHTPEPRTSLTTRGATPRYDKIEALPGESLASLTYRAYGENNSVKRQKIVNANATLDGVINVPR